jgi:hypothetical protein
MKALSQILVLALLTLGSCTSRLYTGAEYDDLYYLPSDKPVVTTKPPVNEQITEGTLKDKGYYDNIYAADTIVADQYSDAVDIGNQIYNNNSYNNNGYNYFDDYSYSGRLRQFYGNYFDPYWRDPFYFDYGYPSFGYGFGYGGFPYSYGFGNSFYGSPYFGYGGYGDYYGGFYPGYYGGFYGGFGSYYYPYYGYTGSYFRSDGQNGVTYGRRERPSTLSSKWNSSNVSASGTLRRDSYLSGGNSGVNRRISSGSQTVAVDQRRTVSSGVNSQQSVNQVNRKLDQNQAKAENIRPTTSVKKNPVNAKPEYNSVNRKYTPSYSNPRMSTRPSYNNSRMYNNSGSVRTPSNQGSYQNPYNSARSNSSGNVVQRRYGSPSGYSVPSGQIRSNSYGNSQRYSVPSRSSVERGSSYSSGSSSGSSRSSYSSGSSSSESRGSYSSGSSSSSSSGRSSSGSSSGRR